MIGRLNSGSMATARMDSLHIDVGRGVDPDTLDISPASVMIVMKAQFTSLALKRDARPRNCQYCRTMETSSRSGHCQEGHSLTCCIAPQLPSQFPLAILLNATYNFQDQCPLAANLEFAGHVDGKSGTGNVEHACCS